MIRKSDSYRMESSPTRQDAVLPDLLTCATTPGNEIESFQMKHLIDVINEFGGVERIAVILTQSVADELNKFGIEHEVSTRSSRKSRKSPRGRNGREKEPLNGINRLVEVQLRSSETKVNIPFIIKETCDFIRRHIAEEGILRKSGSSSRAACIMQRFLTSESDEYFSTFDTVHDVANVLKQYLREMEVPLIPQNIHNLFIQCLDILSESARSEALLLCTCLISPQSIGILSFIMEFLTDVAQSSNDNLMTRENLAIVMGPNIFMPPDIRKNDRSNKESQQSERHLVDLRNKVVEILITNAENVGRISAEVEKRVETFVSLRSSEDELENEGVGRRKKRRSGSLNRMLGFLKKVTSGKGGGETPIIPSTPCGGDSFSHTPIIKGSSRKRNVEDNLFALHKKVRKNGLHFKDGDAKSDASGTPNTLANLVACPSPAICFHPSPMRADWKQTPSGNRLKNFVTPSLLRKREKYTELETNAFSAPTKSSKPRLRFGRKGGKKQEENPESETQALLHKGDVKSSSAISIHKLASSPRSTLQRNPSSRIPRPGGPVRRENSQSDVADIHNDNNDDGDYVTICSTAEVNDVQNEAFIASSLSLTDSEYEPLNTRRSNETVTSSLLTDESISEPPRLGDFTDSSARFRNQLHLTPLIQEIDTLTRTAQELTLSTLKGKSASSLRGIRSRTLPESPTELDTTPINVESVENKFIRTIKETKMMQIRTENINKATNVHRRLSVQERGMSPSRRRILSSARRRSHEIGRVTPTIVASPRFMSLRSPRNQQPPINTSCSTLKRSPTRCTLKRGRPNTARVGLARPSPVRNTPRSGVINRSTSGSEQNKSNEIENSTDSSSITPLRRMSSVQELVHKLEKHRKDKIKSSTNNLQETPCSRNRPNSGTLPDVLPSAYFEPIEIKTVEETIKTPEKALPTSVDNVNWVAANDFKFERKDLRGLRKNADRDSIQVLKTLHAGKVPATVEYFNKIGKHTKSPGRSLIPRYTALHKSGSSKTSLNLDVETPDRSIGSPLMCPGSSGSTEKLSRRLSAVDIRQKHEQLLQNIKKEKAVKRSATTAGSYNLRSKSPYEKRVMEKPQLPARPAFTLTSSARRPTTLELRVSQSSHPLSTRASFRKTPTAQTPTIKEEDECLTASVQKAINNLLGQPTNKPDTIKRNNTKASPIPLSPLKSSNLANINQRKLTVLSCKKGSPNHVSPLAKTNTTGTMVRTISERGTKSTATTPRTTPKIKKALTTRAYDMMGTTGTPRSLKSHAHTCQTITPRRRVTRPIPSEPQSHTPLKATHIFTPKLRSNKQASPSF